MVSSAVRSMVLTLSFASSLAGAQTPLLLADFKSGPGNGVYRFASTTPATVTDLMQPGRAAQSPLLRASWYCPSLRRSNPDCRPWFWCMARAAFTLKKSPSGQSC